MSKSTIVFIAVILLLASSAVICGKNNKGNPEVSESEKPKVTESEQPKVKTAESDKSESKVAESENAEPEMVTTNSGLRYQNLKVGTGIAADNGMNVAVNYTIWLDVDGKKGRKIDSSLDPGREPLPFEVGVRNLIAGWNEGMLGMQVGSIRRLFVPAHLAWGAAGRPPQIPGNTSVIFDIELLEIK